MKKLLLAIAALLPFAGMAQGGYTITGKMTEVKTPAKAYLLIYQGNNYKETDSAEVKNGKFQFKGRVGETAPAIVEVNYKGVRNSGNKSDHISFWLENSNIAIATTDSIKNAKISGSVAEREKQELSALTTPYTDKIIKLQHEFSREGKNPAVKTAEERKVASDSINSYVTQIRFINQTFVENHFNSFMGLYTFNGSILGAKFNPATAEPQFHKFSPELQSSEFGKRIFARIETAKKGQAGATVTDFTQNDVNGKPFTLSSLRGKYVLVDFWASWCAPCRAENPNVRKAYAQLKGKNFEIVSVSLDAGKEQWVEAIKKDGMPWIHVCDMKGWKNDVAVLYGVSSVPQNFLIDPKGVIIARDLRGEDLTEKLSALIK